MPFINKQYVPFVTDNLHCIVSDKNKAYVGSWYTYWWRDREDIVPGLFHITSIQLWLNFCKITRGQKETEI